MRALVLVALAACGSDPAPAPAVPLAVTSIEDLGKLPLPPKGVGRDGGMSGLVGGKLLWTFGDTFLTEHNHIDNSSVLSSTSGWATVADPLTLAHSMDGDQPAQLIPYTADEITANTADALNGYALWPGPALDVGEPTAIVGFQVIKRMSGSGFTTQGSSTARIAVDAPSAMMRAPGLLFTAPDDAYFPTLALDGYVYAFGCSKRGFLDFACKLARAPLASAEQRASYEFYDGKAWVADSSKAAYVIDRTSVAPSISYNAHLGRYLAVNCELVSSTILLRTAPSIEGPWSESVEIAADGTSILPPTNSSQYNYLCVEHPELSAADGTSIVIGFSRPTAPFQGDVRLARVTLR